MMQGVSVLLFLGEYQWRIFLLDILWPCSAYDMDSIVFEEWFYVDK